MVSIILQKKLIKSINKKVENTSRYNKFPISILTIRYLQCLFLFIFLCLLSFHYPCYIPIMGAQKICQIIFQNTWTKHQHPTFVKTFAHSHSRTHLTLLIILPFTHHLILPLLSLFSTCRFISILPSILSLNLTLPLSIPLSASLTSSMTPSLLPSLSLSPSLSPRSHPPCHLSSHPSSHLSPSLSPSLALTLLLTLTDSIPHPFSHVLSLSHSKWMQYLPLFINSLYCFSILALYSLRASSANWTRRSFKSWAAWEIVNVFMKKIHHACSGKAIYLCLVSSDSSVCVAALGFGVRCWRGAPAVSYWYFLFCPLIAKPSNLSLLSAILNLYNENLTSLWLTGL